MASSSRSASLPRLLVITDWSLGADELLGRLAHLVELGPAVGVQHRHPGATGRQFLEEGRQLATLLRPGGLPLFVNGRLDVALLLGAHLHLPASGVDPALARTHLPAGRWLSVAVHDAAEASRAELAELALVSPVFAPRSKPFDPRPPLGVSGFDALARRLNCPAFALGGVDVASASSLAGHAHGLATISGVLAASDPAQAARDLLASLG